MWYPGQEGGHAITDMLLGRTNPGGRLPITFPREITDSPAFAPGHPERYRGVDDRVVYSEGIFTGYRWFDEQAIDPLFPFGHGLSYTSFAYSDLAVTPVAEGLRVRFTVTNSGAVAGSDVPQVYVGRPDNAPVPMARQALAAFERIDLAPGESRTLTLTVPRRQMSYWDEASHTWQMPAGQRSVAVGASSRDLRLTAIAAP
jgi:beta-glucosidase